MGTQKVVKMSLEQAEQAWSWAREEGWNPGLDDHRLLPKIDPDGCLALVDTSNGMMLGSITAVNYGGYGFIGMYIIRSGCRGHGLGEILTSSIAERMKGLSNVGVDAVQQMIPHYKTFGLKPAYDISRYRLPKGTLFSTKCSKDVSDMDIEDIAAYDQSVFNVSRKDFLKAWLVSEHADAAVLRKNGKVAAYGVVRDCYDGRKIGPLFADDPENATDVLGLLLSKRPDVCHYIDIPSLVPFQKDIKDAAEIVMVCTRMYLSDLPQQDVKRVYGNTTFEMG